MVFKHKKQKGFTILELLIAITVFSLSLMLVMAVVIGMGKQYQKATYITQLNDASRTVHQTLSDDINYSKLTNAEVKTAADGSNNSYICLSGNIIYAWPLAVTDDKVGLYKYTGTACDDNNAATAISGGTNLLPKNSFVANFSVNSEANETYVIKTEFRSGTTDMFSLTGTENRTTAGIKCLPTLQGGDFCSAVQYNSVVKPRL